MQHYLVEILVETHGSLFKLREFLVTVSMVCSIGNAHLPLTINPTVALLRCDSSSKSGDDVVHLFGPMAVSQYPGTLVNFQEMTKPVELRGCSPTFILDGWWLDPAAIATKFRIC